MAMQGPTAPPRLAFGPDDHGRAVSSEDFAEADFVEGWKYERSEGELIVMSPPGHIHNENTRPWRLRLSDYWLKHLERVEDVLPEAWMRIGKQADRIGDIGVYLLKEGAVPRMPDRAPDLVFEVVSNDRESRGRDYVEKRAEYHRLGVREYVIVDRFKSCVTVLEFEPRGYRERVLTGAQDYTSPLLPGLVIRLAEVF